MKVSVRRMLRPRVFWLLPVLLALGLVGVPVECSLAAQPHFLFQNPTALAAVGSEGGEPSAARVHGDHVHPGKAAEPAEPTVVTRSRPVLAPRFGPDASAVPGWPGAQGAEPDGATIVPPSGPKVVAMTAPATPVATAFLVGGLGLRALPRSLVVSPQSDDPAAPSLPAPDSPPP